MKGIASRRNGSRRPTNCPNCSGLMTNVPLVLFPWTVSRSYLPPPDLFTVTYIPDQPDSEISIRLIEDGGEARQPIRDSKNNDARTCRTTSLCRDSRMSAMGRKVSRHVWVESGQSYSRLNATVSLLANGGCDTAANQSGRKVGSLCKCSRSKFQPTSSS